MAEKKKSAAAPARATDFPLEDWQAVKAWLSGTGDWWTALAALAKLALWASGKLTAAQKTACQRASKTMRSETLAKPVLASQMDAIEADAAAGKLDLAAIFALLMKVLSLFPFGA